MTTKDDGGDCCLGCGQRLAYAGAIGLFCANDACDYERKGALRMLAETREREERKEYARLKAKYEPQT